MSRHKARVLTIQALLAARPCIVSSANYPVINAEFDEVHLVRKVRRNSRRRLLEVLHSARGLDTMLRTFVQHYGCTSNPLRPPNAMGSYLYALRDHTVGGIGKINETHRNLFQSRIVLNRNKYLHEAGTFPLDDNEVNILLSDMHFCISTVIAL